MQQQRILIVNQRAPYGRSCAHEALDLALSAATFDQHVDLLFVEAGCYPLVAKQEANAIAHKNLAKMFAALPIYGIESLWYDANDLQKLNIDTSMLIGGCKPLGPEKISMLYQHANHVFHF